MHLDLLNDEPNDVIAHLLDFKVFLAVKKYLGDAFKLYLLQFIPDEIYTNVVQAFMEEKYNALTVRRKVMREEHWDLLQSVNSVCGLDITLLGVLLKNLVNGILHAIPKPRCGWSVNPPDDDGSKPAWCLRLINLRNKVFHSPFGTFSDQTSFDAIMVEIENVLNGFGSSSEVLQAFHRLKCLKLEEARDISNQLAVNPAS